MSIVLVGVGLVNFINMILASIISRRKEIATMQSIGTQGKQLRKMLCTEGIIISLSALSGSFMLGTALMPLISDVFAGMVEYYAGYITMTPIRIVYFVVSIIVPVYGKQIISKDSVIIRIRQE